MVLAERFPYARLELGYDINLPILINPSTNEYFVQLPNGRRLEEHHSNPRLGYSLDIGHIWSAEEQKHHGHKWGDSTGAHFAYLVYQTREVASKKPGTGVEWLAKSNLADFVSELETRKQEFLGLLQGLGFLLEESALFLILSADTKSD